MNKHGGKREQAGRKPGSPNRSTVYIRKLAGSHAEIAIQTLVELVQDGDTPAAARVSAAKELLERGFGKSGSYGGIDLEQPLSELTPKQAIEKVTDATTQGQVSLEEGQKLVGMIEARIKAIELAEIETRLSALEGNV